MNAKLLRDLLLLLGLFGLMWAGFAYFTDQFGVVPESMDTDVLKVSISQEEELGDFIIEAFLEGRSEAEDPVVDSAMWAISSRLLQKIDSTDYNYHIYVVRDETVNAMAFPGGNIVVFTGLIELAKTPEEVAAVLAHEIGHVEKRHVINGLIRDLGLAFVLAVVTGGDPTLIHELSETVVSSMFDRKQESEADAFGMELLEESGIDPRALATFFRAMNRENLDYDESMEWLMSHPHNNSRIKASLEYKVADDFVAYPISLDWGKVKERL